MNTKTFEEKMKTLREIHARSHPEAIAQLSQWEDSFARLQATSEWLQHPNTTNLRKIAEEQIKMISDVLAEKEDLGESERKVLFAMKKAHLVYMAVLTENPDNQIKSIEQSVDAELNDNQHD